MAKLSEILYNFFNGPPPGPESLGTQIAGTLSTDNPWAVYLGQMRLPPGMNVIQAAADYGLRDRAQDVAEGYYGMERELFPEKLRAAQLGNKKTERGMYWDEVFNPLKRDLTAEELNQLRIKGKYLPQQYEDTHAMTTAEIAATRALAAQRAGGGTGGGAGGGAGSGTVAVDPVRLQAEYDDYVSREKARYNTNILGFEDWLRREYGEPVVRAYHEKVSGRPQPSKLSQTGKNLGYIENPIYSYDDWIYADRLIQTAPSGKKDKSGKPILGSITNAIIAAIRRYEAGQESAAVVMALVDRWNRTHPNPRSVEDWYKIAGIGAGKKR